MIDHIIAGVKLCDEIAHSRIRVRFGGNSITSGTGFRGFFRLGGSLRGRFAWSGFFLGNGAAGIGLFIRTDAGAADQKQANAKHE